MLELCGQTNNNQFIYALLDSIQLEKKERKKRRFTSNFVAEGTRFVLIQDNIFGIENPHRLWLCLRRHRRHRHRERITTRQTVRTQFPT